MTTRTMTRTSSAKSWLGTMSLTRHTGTTSHRRVSPTLAGGEEGVPRFPPFSTDLPPCVSSQGAGDTPDGGGAGPADHGGGGHLP